MSYRRTWRIERGSSLVLKNTALDTCTSLIIIAVLRCSELHFGESNSEYPLLWMLRPIASTYCNLLFFLQLRSTASSKCFMLLLHPTVGFLLLWSQWFLLFHFCSQCSISSALLPYSSSSCTRHPELEDPVEDPVESCIIHWRDWVIDISTPDVSGSTSYLLTSSTNKSDNECRVFMSTSFDLLVFPSLNGFHWNAFTEKSLLESLHWKVYIGKPSLETSIEKVYIQKPPMRSLQWEASIEKPPCFRLPVDLRFQVPKRAIVQLRWLCLNWSQFELISLCLNLCLARFASLWAYLVFVLISLWFNCLTQLLYHVCLNLFLTKTFCLNFRFSFCLS